ncbi:MAG: ComEA family DNA-binding protein [Snowella sp.]|nr:ComEA family DNA-binding protein [Snowella sp.]
MLNFRRQTLKRKILNDPFYRFQSLEEVAIASELGIKIEVNQATVDEWLRLPGISIHQARNLVELTAMGMQFLSIEDLAAALSLPLQRLQPLKKILSFTYYDNESLLTPQRINVNTANLDQLITIPLLDLGLAEAIIRDRQNQGNFQNLVDFQRRLNLNVELISQLMHYLQF